MTLEDFRGICNNFSFCNSCKVRKVCKKCRKQNFSSRYRVSHLYLDIIKEIRKEKLEKLLS